MEVSKMKTLVFTLIQYDCFLIKMRNLDPEVCKLGECQVKRQAGTEGRQCEDTERIPSASQKMLDATRS